MQGTDQWIGDQSGFFFAVNKLSAQPIHNKLVAMPTWMRSQTRRSPSILCSGNSLRLLPGARKNPRRTWLMTDS
jgi:hypothetical protein